ncbi:MAG: DUF4160 domain-containing protein [Betaproteobacteria bacterium]|nr:DUF4160 domain-containing protein [Betaproteobacteria bacterium]
MNGLALRCALVCASAGRCHHTPLAQHPEPTGEDTLWLERRRTTRQRTKTATGSSVTPIVHQASQPWPQHLGVAAHALDKHCAVTVTPPPQTTASWDGEPFHVHVDQGAATAKVWLRDGVVAGGSGFRGADRHDSHHPHVALMC